MKLKRIIALALSLCMITGMLSGCGGKKDKESGGGNDTVGKYVEEDVEIPMMEEDESMVALNTNANGELEVYTTDANEAYFKYVSADGKEWVKEDASWLHQISGGYLTSVTAGADGNHYAIVTDEVAKMHLLKQIDETTAEEISVPELNEASDEDMEASYYSFGTEVYVMENGSIVLAGTEGVKVYSSEDGELLHTFNYSKTSSDANNPIDIHGENIVMPSKDNKGFTVWNVEKETEVATSSYDSDVREGRAILEENNEIYYLNTDGIHHMNPKGTLIETLVEGESMAMGMPSTWIMGFAKGPQDDFYALYMLNQDMALKHYYYDENAKMKQDKKLSIYSLEENDTIRQAVSVFQQQYPDVEVSYKTGDADSSTTNADKIRVLNTELLNKSGADILVLDNLPMDSFVEKGVLKDISDIIDPLVEDGTLQKNIAECYQEEDGKMYGMPVKYGVPILIGKQEVLDAVGSLDALENWLDTHEGQKIISYSSYGDLTRLFVNMYYDELFDKEGKVKEDKLKQCISCAKRIGELYDAEIETSYIDEETGENYEEMDDFYLSEWDAGDGMAAIEESQVVSWEMRSIYDMMVPCMLMRDSKLPFSFNKDIFVPHGIVGINNASENTELAEEFLKVLLSDEVQNYDLMDGFPVNKNAAEKLKEQGIADSNSDENTAMIISGEDEDGNTYTISMPSVEEIESFLEKNNELKQAAKTDSVLQDMIMEEAKAYYEGSQELDATVQAIKAKVDTYRAE